MRIAAIGEILVDMTQTLTDGNGIPHFAANPGGAPANVVVAAAKLGAATAFIGCVGDDAFGRLLRGKHRRPADDAARQHDAGRRDGG